MYMFANFHVTAINTLNKTILEFNYVAFQWRILKHFQGMKK